MKRKLALGLTMVMTASTLAACGSQDTESIKAEAGSNNAESMQRSSWKRIPEQQLNLKL